MAKPKMFYRVAGSERGRHRHRGASPRDVADVVPVADLLQRGRVSNERW